MTKKDLFRVIFKLFGLYALIVTILTAIPQIFIQISLNVLNDLYQYLFIFIVVAIFTTIIFILIFHVDFFIRILKLDQGFDEERIHFENLNNENIVKISAILLGGMMVLQALPGFLVQSFLWFKAKSTNYDQLIDPIEGEYLFIDLVEILIGYILMTNYRSISKLLRISNEEKRPVM